LLGEKPTLTHDGQTDDNPGFSSTARQWTTFSACRAVVLSRSLPAPPPPEPDLVSPNGNWTVDAEPLSLTFFGVELHFEQAGEARRGGPLRDPR